VGTFSSELAAQLSAPLLPRVYADANIPAGVVAFMREALHWDVLFVVEHDDLRRASDRRHFELARQLARTLVTLDRDYLDDARYPADQTGGIVVLYAPNEMLLTRTLQQLDARVFRAEAPPGRGFHLPLAGRKLVADPGWVDR
jgi:predicted nuclease of predicted toxin-antitoxin system